VEKAMTPAVTQEMILMALVLFLALKYRQANFKYNKRNFIRRKIIATKQIESDYTNDNCLWAAGHRPRRNSPGWWDTNRGQLKCADH
jgi:hypothetical protein